VDNVNKGLVIETEHPKARWYLYIRIYEGRFVTDIGFSGFQTCFSKEVVLGCTTWDLGQGRDETRRSRR
jgi:hypothetical protein